MTEKKLYRTENENKMLCGVCGGIAEYFSVDPTLVRVGCVLLTLCGASLGFWGYIACAIIIPKKSTIHPDL